MPTISPCVPCCSTPQTVSVPGPEGVGGSDGADGLNAYTTLTAPFTSDGSQTITIAVGNSDWMVPGQIIVIGAYVGGVLFGPVHAIVVESPASTSVTVTELGYAGDGIGDVLPVGARVGPSGIGASAIQSVSGTLVAGTLTINTLNITGSSTILVQRTDVNGGDVGFLVVENPAPGTPGSFDVNSYDATGAGVAGDVSIFSALVIG